MTTHAHDRTETSSADRPQKDQYSFGIDVGGSGIKGAVVDLATGEFVSDRIRIPTPQPATPDAVAQTIAKIVEQAHWSGPIGITLPSIVRHQVAQSAANIDPSWVGVDTHTLFGSYIDHTFTVINDADAAGLAEVLYGNTQARKGSVCLLTLGTGIGSALFIDGHLYPNTEFGHILVDGKEAEARASAAVREKKQLTYKQWAKRLNKVLAHYEFLLNPDLFIIGGGVSRSSEKWMPYLTVKTPIVPAALRNRAGIVGAAYAVAQGICP